MPITTKPDLGRLVVPIDPRSNPSAYGTGPLSVDSSVICLKDGQGDDAGLWFDAEGPTLIGQEGRRLTLRKVTVLPEQEWLRLRDRIRRTLAGWRP